MAYCTITDVRGLNPKRTYGATTTPTSTQVEAYITLIAVEIDAVLQAKGYTVPVTTPANFLTFLGAVNAYGAAYLAEHGMFPEVADKGATPHWKTLLDIYQKYLKMLEDGSIIPDSLAPGTSSSDVASNYTEDDDQDNYPDPAFFKSEDDLEF